MKLTPKQIDLLRLVRQEQERWQRQRVTFDPSGSVCGGAGLLNRKIWGVSPLHTYRLSRGIVR